MDNSIKSYKSLLSGRVYSARSGRIRPVGTVAAGSIEISNMTVYMAIKISPGNILNPLDAVHLQIHDTATFRAHEMIMRGSICIKMVNSIADPQPLDLTDLGQEG